MDASRVVELPELHDRVRVFRDRADAGAALARMLAGRLAPTALVLAIPAGGVPVAAVVAATLGLPLDLAVVSKILLPEDTEAGYGAVAFDGTVRLNEPLVAALGLERAVVAAGLAATRERVARRVETLYCSSIRAGRRFAVADAYRRWTDVDEEEVRRELARAGGNRGAARASRRPGREP